MRLPRPRFTVRSLMIAVAVAGSGLALEAYRRHLVAASEFYRSSATIHRFEFQTLDFNAKMSELEREATLLFPGTGNPEIILDEAAMARGRRLSAYHQQMTTKYERAAQYPWLPIEPDLPEPK